MADPLTMAALGAGAGAMLSPDDPLKGAALGGIGGAVAGPAMGAAGVGAGAGTAAESAMFMTAPFESLGAGGIAATNGMPTIGTGLSGAVSGMAAPQNVAKMGMSMMNQNQQRPMGPPPAAPMMRPQMPSGPIMPPMQRDPEEMRRLAGRSNYAGYLG